MVQLMIRDVPDEIAAALQKRAARNGRSAEAEHRAILEDTLVRDEALKTGRSDFWERAARMREELRGRGLHFDSASEIRQDRDER